MSLPASVVPGSSAAESDFASAYREAGFFIRWGAVIILLAHGIDVAAAGGPNWPALAIRFVWFGLLVSVSAMFRTGRRSMVVPAVAIGVFGCAILDVAMLAVTGGAASPLLAFTPVLAVVLPFVAFDLLWLGVAGSTLLILGTGLLLFVDGADRMVFIALANAGGGAILSGWLLARAVERSRQAERRRRIELAEAMASVRTLRGMLPLCAWCRRVRTDAGYWEQIETYITAHSDARFTHGLCQECERTHFPDLVDEAEPTSELVAGR